MAKKAARKPAPKSRGKTTKVVKKPVRTTAARPRPKSAGKAAKPVKPVKKKVVVSRKPAAPEPIGRPLITAEEKLYLLFKEDYHARQIFEFLRVNTVGELEQYSAEQIIRILSAPVRNTVERIRARLAQNKRYLRNDDTFAREFLMRGPD